jgi:hypothetical protein
MGPTIPVARPPSGPVEFESLASPVKRLLQPPAPRIVFCAADLLRKATPHDRPILRTPNWSASCWIGGTTNGVQTHEFADSRRNAATRLDQVADRRER